MTKPASPQFELVPLETPPERKGLVVFVHGILGSAASWGRFRELLAEDDWVSARFDLGFFSYSSRFHFNPLKRTPSIETVAKRLASSLDLETRDYERIVLVGHSQGGLVIQRFLADRVRRNRGRSLARIRRVLLFACPNNGTEFARSARRLLVDRLLPHPQARSLQPYDEEIAKDHLTVLEQIVRADTVTEGTCPIPVVAYAGSEDNVVQPPSARGAFSDYKVITGDHSSLIKPATHADECFRHLVDELRIAADEPIPEPRDAGAARRAAEGPKKLVVGAKVFLESNFLCELFAQVIESVEPDVEVERRFNIGETAEVFSQLRNRTVDLYAEYSGTLMWELLGLSLQTLRSERDHTAERLNAVMAGKPGFERLRVGRRLGFSNAYSLVMLRQRAKELGVETISDLAALPQRLTLQSHYSFASRPDCYPGLRETYRGLDLDLVSDRRSRGFDALAEKKVDLVTGYTTDPEVAEPPSALIVLEDDRSFFGFYYAIPLTTTVALEKAPELLAHLNRLHGRIDEKRMAGALADAKATGLESVDLTPPQQGALKQRVERFLTDLEDGDRD